LGPPGPFSPNPVLFLLAWPGHACRIKSALVRQDHAALLCQSVWPTLFDCQMNRPAGLALPGLAWPWPGPARPACLPAKNGLLPPSA